MSIPLSILEGFYRLPFLRRPSYLAKVVPECPSAEELSSGFIAIEKRNGYLKCAHLLCPRCGDHIQLPLAGSERWSVNVDWLRRPTAAPSIWEKAACDAHFFVRKGNVIWCE